MNNHDITTEALRGLDPAPREIDADALGRGAEMLARILATPPGPVGSPRARRSSAKRRWVPALGAAAVAAVATPIVLVGGGNAFATWTPEVEMVTGAAARQAESVCVGELGVDDKGLSAVSVDRRGEWTHVVFAGPGTEGACLMPTDQIGRDGALVDRKVGFFGYHGQSLAEEIDVADGELVETGYMDGSVSVPSGIPLVEDQGYFAWAQGRVGPEVVGVTVRTPGGVDVEAAIGDGRFAAWWPTTPQSTGAWSYVVTLTDGSTRTTLG